MSEHLPGRPVPAVPPVQPLAPGERRVWFSPPVLRTSIILSLMLLLFFVGLWFMLEQKTRSMFTGPQIGTLIFFMVVMWLIMLGIGFSRMVATPEGLSVRNWLHTRHFAWDEVEDITFGSGDSWPHLQLAPTDQHPDGHAHAVLGIQRAEGPQSRERVLEVRALIRAQRAAGESASRA